LGAFFEIELRGRAAVLEDEQMMMDQEMNKIMNALH
jgi:hypothetical protein